MGYDANVLQLVSATEGASFSDTSFGPTTKNPFNIIWDDSAGSSNNTANDVIATLTFRILDTAAAGKSDITISYNQADVYNYDWDDVTFATVAGSVTGEDSEPSIDYETEFPEATHNNGANIRFETCRNTF